MKTALAVLVAIIGLLSYALYNQIGQTAMHQERAAGAIATAKTCSDSVASMKSAADAREKALGKALAASQERSKQRAAMGQRELTRAPAVAGDSCASAEQENREWLERRRSTK